MSPNPTMSAMWVDPSSHPEPNGLKEDHLCPCLIDTNLQVTQFTLYFPFLFPLFSFTCLGLSFLCCPLNLGPNSAIDNAWADCFTHKESHCNQRGLGDQPFLILRIVSS